MEMEVVDFNFDSSCSSPYMTAPPSPQRFGNFYFSASAFYRELNNLSLHDVIPRSLASLIPFNWEERFGIPKSKATNNGGSDNNNDGGEDFEFDFSGHLEQTSLSTDMLFDGKKIKPQKPPPQLQVLTGANDHSVSISYPKSPRSRISQGKRMVQEALSPHHKKKFYPFATVIKETRKKDWRIREGEGCYGGMDEVG